MGRRSIRSAIGAFRRYYLSFAGIVRGNISRGRQLLSTELFLEVCKSAVGRRLDPAPTRRGTLVSVSQTLSLGPIEHRHAGEASRSARLRWRGCGSAAARRLPLSSCARRCWSECALAACVNGASGERRSRCGVPRTKSLVTVFYVKWHDGAQEQASHCSTATFTLHCLVWDSAVCLEWESPSPLIVSQCSTAHLSVREEDHKD